MDAITYLRLYLIGKNMTKSAMAFRIALNIKELERLSNMKTSLLEDAQATVKHQILNGHINVYSNVSSDAWQQSILDAILEPHVIWAIKMLVDRSEEELDAA